MTLRIVCLVKSQQRIVLQGLSVDVVRKIVVFFPDAGLAGDGIRAFVETVSILAVSSFGRVRVG